MPQSCGHRQLNHPHFIQTLNELKIKKEHLSVHPFTCLSTLSFVRPYLIMLALQSIRPSAPLSVRLSVRPSVRPSVLPSVRPSIRPFVRMSICPSIGRSIRASIFDASVSRSASWSRFQMAHTIVARKRWRMIDL